jgi:hypothetical protein
MALVLVVPVVGVLIWLRVRSVDWAFELGEAVDKRRKDREAKQASPTSEPPANS